MLSKIAKRQVGQKLDPHLEDQFASGRLLACISSRPGQCGRSDGYITYFPSYIVSFILSFYHAPHLTPPILEIATFSCLF